MGYRLLTGRILLSIAVFVNYSMFGQRLPYDNPTLVILQSRRIIGIVRSGMRIIESQEFPFNQIDGKWRGIIRRFHAGNVNFFDVTLQAFTT